MNTELDLNIKKQSKNDPFTPSDFLINPNQKSISSNVLTQNQEEIKTPLRLQYEAQVEVIKKQIGDLESVREKLGLSQRKICQLLMIDPSSWSRWVVKKDPVPPQIYRALQWYMALNEKIPGLTPQYFIGKDPEVLHQVAIRTMNQAISNEQHQRNQELESIKIELKNFYSDQSKQNLLLQNKINWLVIILAVTLVSFGVSIFLLK